MTRYTEVFLTDEGLALAERMREDRGTLTIRFTRIETGNGEYTDEDSRQGMTALKSPQQSFTIYNSRSLGDELLELQFIASNINEDGTPLLEGYTIREVGLYVKPDGEDEFLYSISLLATDDPTVMYPFDAIEKTVAIDIYLSVGGTISPGITWGDLKYGRLSSRGGNADSVPNYKSKEDHTELVDIRNSFSGETYPTAGDAVRAIAEDLDTLNDSLEDTIGRSIPDGFVLEGNDLYLTVGGNPIGEPIDLSGISGGGGGGGGGNNAVLTASNASGWINKTIAYGGPVTTAITWASIENEMPTGNGSLKVMVNGIVKSTLEVQQGTVTVNVTNYLSPGSNTIRMTVTDVYGNSRSLTFSVNAIELTLTSQFDSSVPYNTDVQFTYVATGKVNKLMHFMLDGHSIGTQEVTTSGRQLSYMITSLTHGAHSLSAYFTCEVDGTEVRSNTLYYEIICLQTGHSEPIITSNFNTLGVDQYSTIVIPYSVYTPGSLTSSVELSVNSEVVSTLTVDRTVQTWSYKVTSAEPVELTIESGEAMKSFYVVVTPVNIDVEPTTDNMSLYLSSYGRSNNEENPGSWVFGDVESTFTGFNFVSDGWVLDDDNNTVLRVSGNARLTIPVKIFENDFRSTGKTIEIEFATKDVRNYDSVIFSCMSEGRGLQLTAQKALMRSEQSELGTQYKEGEHVRIGFVVEKRSDYRLAYVYINGIISGVVQYPVDDDFAQAVPVNITVGSNDCTIDLYCIRVYEQNLNRQQMLDNWIADTQKAEDMIYRYNHNNVYDDYGNIVISKLPTDLPYMIIHAAQLPQYKGDKKTVSITYVDQENPARSFEAEGVSANVQGTSSQYYARKNYKLSYKNGITYTASGAHADGIALRPGAIETDEFTMKADVASSEGANNVELVRLYNDTCPYKTPGQIINSACRQGIDGFPIVMFWDNGEETVFLGKYNWNNDKGTPEVFGFTEGDESWEILNNTSNRVLWKSDDFTSTIMDESGKQVPAWQSDFESRFPEDYYDPTQLQAFAAWVKSTDRSQATGAVLPEEVEYEGNYYVYDTPEYRLAKFKAEAGDWMELQSAMFYYLFTEMFLMVDSRAKNAFPSFIGSQRR